MMTHTAQSVPQKGTMYTELSLSIHPNTTNCKDPSIRRGKSNLKQSYFGHNEHKNYNSVIENANRELQEYLFNLNDQIRKVIQKRQSNYIAAFENHIQLVEKELKKIKKEAEFANSKERTVSLQEVISRLQRQCTIFRLEAMKYFELVEEKQEQNKNLKRQISLLRRQLQVSQFSKRKLLQKIKIDTALSEFEQIETSPEFYKEFKKSKEKAHHERTHTENSTGFKDRKFRKTLLQFDLKNSSEYFKQPTSGRRTARSFLTHASFRQDLTKTNKFPQKQTTIDEANLKEGKNVKRVSSVVRINCIENEEAWPEPECSKLINSNTSCLFGEELKTWLKEVMAEKFIGNTELFQEKKPKKNQFERIFKFNQEQSINDFIEIIFGPSNSQINAKRQKISTEIFQKTQFPQSESTLYPFERISTHKKLERVLDSSIYTVQKTEKEIDFVIGNDSTVRTKVIKHPAKKVVNSTKWINFRLNKTETKTKTRLENNLNFYIEKERESQK